MEALKVYGTMTDQEYIQSGGIRIGRNYWISMNYSMPFARIILRKNGIVLKVRFLFLIKDYTIDREDVTKISEYRGFFSKGIKISHKVPLLPSFIVFWTTNRKELTDAFNALLYPVQTDGSQ